MWHITLQKWAILSKFHGKFCYLNFSFGENNCAHLFFIVHFDKTFDTIESVMIRTLYSEMLDCGWSLILTFWDEIDFLFGWIHEFTCYFIDPFRNSGWKHKILGFLSSLIFNKVVNVLDIQFKTFFEHLIGLIDTCCLELTEIYALSLNKIHKSAWSGDDDINSVSQFTDLIVNWGTSINCYNIEIILTVS